MVQQPIGIFSPRLRLDKRDSSPEQAKWVPLFNSQGRRRHRHSQQGVVGKAPLHLHARSRGPDYCRQRAPVRRNERGILSAVCMHKEDGSVRAEIDAADYIGVLREVAFELAAKVCMLYPLAKLSRRPRSRGLFLSEYVDCLWLRRRPKLPLRGNIVISTAMESPRQDRVNCRPLRDLCSTLVTEHREERRQLGFCASDIRLETTVGVASPRFSTEAQCHS